jgi:hypothetical protein
MRGVWLLAAACAAAAGCGGSPDDGRQNVLSGTVRLNGQPPEYVMIVAVGPDGKEVSGPRMPDGSYQIVDPPTGPLKFKFAGGPPPPPGTREKSNTGNIPAKYLSVKNELQFDYTGGRQKYDIDLKP